MKHCYHNGPEIIFSDKWNSFSLALLLCHLLKQLTAKLYLNCQVKYIVLNAVNREIQVFFLTEVFYHTEPLECNVSLCPISVL